MASSLCSIDATAAAHARLKAMIDFRIDRAAPDGKRKNPAMREAVEWLQLQGWKLSRASGVTLTRNGMTKIVRGGVLIDG